MPEDNIQKTGQLTWRELQELNKANTDIARQSLSDVTESFKKFRQIGPTEIGAGNIYNNQEYVQALADQQGFGESRLDKRLIAPEQLEDLNQFRGEQQSWIGQVGNGVAKALALTGTTFIDTFAGTAAGMINTVGQAISGNVESGKDALAAFVDNPVSNALQRFNDWTENVFKNYETREQQNAYWWQKLGSGTFIGDHFIKNLGFFVGAYLNGMTTSSLLTKAMKIGDTRKIFEGAAKSAIEGGAEGAEALRGLKTGDAVNALLKGDAVLTDKGFAESLIAQARAVKNSEVAVKAISSIAGAMGESRIEAITGSKDYIDAEKENLDAAMYNYVNGGAEEELAQEHPDWFSQEAVIDENGNLRGYRRVAANTKVEGELAKRIADKQQKYEETLNLLADQKKDYLNSTFLMNMAILASDYAFQFGDAFVGGFGKARVAKGLVDLIDGKYKEMAGREIAKSAIGSLMSPVTEGTQEMFQEAIQKGGRKYYGNIANKYYGEVIDEQAQKDATNYISSFISALGDVYSDPEEWENFALGAVTALLGMPGTTSVIDEKTGKPVLDEKGREKKKLQWNGEFWEGIRNIREISQQATLDANALNALIEDPDKREMYYNLVRQIQGTDKQQRALMSGNEKDYKDAEYDKFVSRALTYIETGRYNDLLDEIEKIYTISEKDVREVKATTIDKATGKSIYDGKTNKQIVEEFAKQKEEMLRKAERIKETADSISRIYGNVFSREGYNQVVSLATTIDDREERIQQVSQEVLDFFNKNILAANRAGVARLQTLKDIHDLAVYIDRDGKKSRLDRLNEVRKEVASYGEDHPEYRRLKREEAKLVKEIAKIERDEKGRYKKKADWSEDTEQQHTSLAEARKALADLKEIIDYGDAPLGMSQKVYDLARLLKDREKLVIALNDWSKNPAKREASLRDEIANSLDAYRDKVIFSQYDDVNKYEGKQNKLNAFKQMQPTDEIIEKYQQRAKETDNKEMEEALDEYKKLDEESTKWGDAISEYLQDKDYGQSAAFILMSANQAYTDATSKDDFIKKATGMLELMQKDPNIDDATKELAKTILDKVKAQKKAENSDKSGKTETPKGGKKTTNKLVVARVNKLLNAEDLDEAIGSLNNGEINMLLMDPTIMSIANPDADQDFLKNLPTKEDRAEALQSAIQVLRDEGVIDFFEYVNNNDDESNNGGNPNVVEMKPEDAAKDGEVGFSSEDVTYEAPANNGQQGQGENGGGTNKEVRHPVEMVPASKKERDANGEGENGKDITDALAVNRDGAGYDIDDLKDKSKRKATKNTKHWANRVLEACKTQEFIDSGELAQLIENARRNGKTPIFRFVQIKGNHWGDESIGKANHEADNGLFIAVELPLNSEGKPINVNGKTSEARTRQLGKNTYMQVLGYVSPKSSKRYKNLLNEVKKQIDNVEAGLSTEDREGKKSYFIVEASDIQTDVELIFSGRMVKSNERFPDVGERDFRDIVTDENGKIISQEGKIQIVAYRREQGPIVIGKPIGDKIVPLNKLREQSPQTRGDRSGTPWIRVKEADGKVYHKAVSVKAFDENYKEGGTYYDDRISEAIKELIDAEDIKGYKKALSDLQKYIYIPKNEKLFISPKDKTLRKGSDSISLEDASVEDVKNFIKQFGYRFTFGNNDATVDNIIESNILTTDLAQIRNANASFFVSEVEVDKDGNWEKIPSEQVKEFVSLGIPHTGSREFVEGENYGPRITFGSDPTIYRQKGYGKDASFWVEQNGVMTEVDKNSDTAFKIGFATDIKAKTGNAVATGYFMPARKGEKAKHTIYCKKDRNGVDIYMTDDFQLLSNKEVADLQLAIKDNKKRDAAIRRLQKSRAEYTGQEERKVEEPEEPEKEPEDKNPKSGGRPKMIGGLPAPRPNGMTGGNDSGLTQIQKQGAQHISQLSRSPKIRERFDAIGSRIIASDKLDKNSSNLEISQALVKHLPNDVLKQTLDTRAIDEKQSDALFKKIEAIINCLK